MVKEKIKFFVIFLIELLIIILSINTILASTDINSYDYLKLNISNQINFDINFERNYNINFVNLNSYFLPETINETQYLNKFETNFDSYEKIKNGDVNFLKFEFNKNSLKNKNSIKNNFIVESLKDRPKIFKQINYPIKNLESKYLKYLKFEELIDTNDQIKEEASNLATGEDDVFIISAKIAKWIREDINYDLKTSLENPNQKSSEVFVSKKGVCKEITNLYVSMIRSLGIPARVVSGYAYTDSEELVDFLNSNWGGHAWAEVLIGDKWIPFDLTYNEYGYVDASHIILDRTKNTKESSVKINGSGYGFNFVKNSLIVENSFKILDKKKLQKFDQKKSFDINISGPKQLGFDSYGYMKINVKNKENFYQVLFLDISKVKEVELLDNSRKMIILKPFEEKEIYFRYKIPKLNSDYIYTLPFTLQNEFIKKSFNVTAKSSFKSINKIELPKDLIEEQKFTNNELLFDCNFIFSEPKNNILCSVKNNNNYELNNINICINKTNCKKINLKLNEITSINFYTSKFSENINYSYFVKCDEISNNNNDNNNLNEDYCLKSNQIKVGIEKPKLIVNKKLDINYLNLSYYINNSQEGILVEIYLNSVKVGTFKNKYSNILKLNKGKNEIELKTIYLGHTLEDYKFEENISKTKNEIFLESQTFFDKFLSFILNLKIFK